MSMCLAFERNQWIWCGQTKVNAMKILHVGNPEAFKNFAICNYFLKQGYEIHYFSPKPLRKKYDGIIYNHEKKNDNSSKL